MYQTGFYLEQFSTILKKNLHAGLPSQDMRKTAPGKQIVVNWLPNHECANVCIGAKSIRQL